MIQKKHMSKRCSWPDHNDVIMIAYHDTEWGVPVHDDKVHFEYLLLDTFQAGLSWKIILHKRQNFKKAFDNFNYRKIAKYDQRKINQLLKDKGIIRNKLKIIGTIKNANAFMEIQKEFGSFDNYVWQFVGRKVKKNKWKLHKKIPSTSRESDEMSKDMKKRGFKFVGSTVCYAYMQGAGLINDHLISCFRYKEVK